MTVALVIGVVLIVGFFLTSGQIGKEETGQTEEMNQDLQGTDEALDMVLGDYDEMDLSNFTVEDDL